MNTFRLNKDLVVNDAVSFKTYWDNSPGLHIGNQTPLPLTVPL